ncbi:prolyl oligopeptidase family serine peptidase [Microbacterium sp. A8/3-1]|uniref:prolyl oligopeptidase n=1 Tax=Microbacterium sp. A8/3-1 TaxID=3160749 RepID=A0AAU7W003_9MICO
MTWDPMVDPYPETRRDEVVDVLHGVPVADPYRWLEDADSRDTAEWVRRQNAFTESYLAQLPERDWFRRRMSEELSRPRGGAPRKLGGRYFVSRNDGTWNQNRWFMADTLDELRSGGGRLVLDPNEWAADGSASVVGFEVTDDGRLLNYVVSEGGSDWCDYRLLDLETGERRPDAFIQSKGLPPIWLPDCSSYVYARPMQGAAMSGTETEATGRWRILLHDVGTPGASDRVLLDQEERPNALYHLAITHDRRWLVVQLHEGTALTNRLWVFPLSAENGRTVIGPPLRVIDDDVAAFEFIRVEDDRLYCRTDLDAERGRVISIDLAAFAASGTRVVREVVGESASTLSSVLPAGDELILFRLVDAVPRLDRHSLTGDHLGTSVVPPGEPIRTGCWASPSSDEYFLAWTTPTRLSFPLVGTVESNRLEPLDSPATRGVVEPIEVTVAQEWAVSRDGTRIPYFLVRAPGKDAAGPRPTLLWGYGGFGISIGTAYHPVLAAGWIAAGGTVAIANLRGGGEFGAAWHDAGKGANKQNVFDDFIAVGERLKSTGVTGPDQLVIQGVSNGGLLVGAVITQRPDLAAVALPGVAVLDMLRFHRFTFGAAWISDYGDPEDRRDFEVARAYSPLHNARPAEYPATLVTTGDHDDRVVPLHSHKFTATLQREQRGPAPILTRIETAGGHGGGKGKAKLVDELSDLLAFAAHHSGLATPERSRQG